MIYVGHTLENPSDSSKFIGPLDRAELLAAFFNARFLPPRPVTPDAMGDFISTAEECAKMQHVTGVAIVGDYVETDGFDRVRGSGAAEDIIAVQWVNFQSRERGDDI